MSAIECSLLSLVCVVVGILCLERLAYWKVQHIASLIHLREKEAQNCNRHERTRNYTDFTPTATYDPDGDCIEFLVTLESFHADRVDDYVTIYFCQASGEFAGCLIKGVRKMVGNRDGEEKELG